MITTEISKPIKQIWHRAVESGLGRKGVFKVSALWNLYLPRNVIIQGVNFLGNLDTPVECW